MFNRAPDGRTDIELAIKANYVHVNNVQKNLGLVNEDLIQEFKSLWETHRHRPYVARDSILASFCPQVSFGINQLGVSIYTEALLSLYRFSACMP